MKSCCEKDESVNILKVTICNTNCSVVDGEVIIAHFEQGFFLRKNHSGSVEHALKYKPYVSS